MYIVYDQINAVGKSGRFATVYIAEDFNSLAEFRIRLRNSGWIQSPDGMEFYPKRSSSNNRDFPITILGCYDTIEQAQQHRDKYNKMLGR